MMVLQTLLILSVSLLLCSGARLPRESSLEDDKEVLLPGTDTCGLSGSQFTNRISGDRSVKLKELPWKVALGYVTGQDKIKWKCGGNLITNQHVLAAAHCVDRFALRRANLTTVRLGELDLDDSVEDGAQPQDIAVESIIVHEQFNRFARTNDIAIITMKTKVTFTDFIRPICLSPEVFTTQDFAGHHPTVAGWGLPEHIENDTRLMKVDVKIQNTDDCRRMVHSNYFGNLSAIDSRVICTFPVDKDACKVQSGGALMMPKKLDHLSSNRYFLMGFVSYGPECSSLDNPMVYTNVSSFKNWIIEKLNV